MNTRQLFPNNQRLSWRYGGAWDTDNPFVPLLARSHVREQYISKNDSKSEVSNRIKTNHNGWICWLLLVFIILILTQF
jgi:hypothetical protein